MSFFKTYFFFVIVLWIIYNFRVGYNHFLLLKDFNYSQENKIQLIRREIGEKSIESLLNAMSAPLIFIFEIIPRIIVYINSQ